jgi:hypothetical protein
MIVTFPPDYVIEENLAWTATGYDIECEAGKKVAERKGKGKE